MRERIGKASLQFSRPPLVLSAASVAGKKEGEGPLGDCFDEVVSDEMMGKENWEEAESAFQERAAYLALQKGGLQKEEIRYLFAGDLLGQLIATSFGTANLEIPTFGLYGACSTMGEAMSLGAMAVNAGYADCVIAMVSSHFATAEKEFRFPLGYGNQRPLSATWTVTGSGCVVLGENDKNTKALAKITGITTGRIVDLGVRDSMNMGAAMAPAAFSVIEQNLEDFGIDETHYDRIITGDLGNVGQTILLKLFADRGRDLSGIHMDCGRMIYDCERQDVHSGGSGCGCSALTLCAEILPKISTGEWRRVLFVPTGALLSGVSFNEGKSIPGIAHAVVLEHLEGVGK